MRRQRRVAVFVAVLTILIFAPTVAIGATETTETTTSTTTTKTPTPTGDDATQADDPFPQWLFVATIAVPLVIVAALVGTIVLAIQWARRKSDD